MDFTTLANIGKAQAELEAQAKDESARGAITANTLIDKSGAADEIYNTVAGPAIQMTAFAADKTGLKDTANSLMSRLASHTGLTLEGEVNTRTGDASELLKYIGPSAIGSATWGLVKGTIRNEAKHDVSKLVSKPSSLKKLGNASGELSTQNLFITAGDVTTARATDKGEIETKTGNAEDFAKMYAANLSGDAMIAASGVTAARSFKEALVSRKIKKSIADNDFSELNLDQDAIISINDSVIGSTNKGMIEPVYTVDEAVNMKEDFDAMVTNRDFKGVITNGKGEYARVRSDGTVDITTPEVSEATGNEIVKFAEDTAVIKNGAVDLDTFNHITSKSYKSLDEIDVDIPYAVVDKNNNVRIKTEVLGDVKGKMLRSGEIIADIKNSNIARSGYGLTYKGKHVLRGIDKNTAAIKQAFGNMSEAQIKNFTDFAYKIDADGKIRPNKDFVNALDRRIGDEDIHIDNNAIFEAIDSAGVKLFGNDAAVGTRSIDKKQTPYKQYLLASGVERPIGGDLGALRDIVSNNFDNTISSVLEEKLNAFISKNPDMMQNKAYFDFMNSIKVEDGVQFQGLKPEFKKAIDTAYAIELAKAIDENKMVSPSQLSTGIINTAFDLLGAEGKSAHVESVKRNFQDLLGNDSFNHTLTEGHAKKVVDNDGRTTSLKQVDSEIDKLFDDLLGTTLQERSAAINNILNHGYTSEKYGYNVTGEPGIVKNKFGIPDEIDPLGSVIADKMRNTAYFISNENKAVLENYIALSKGMPAKAGRLSKAEAEIAYILGDLEPGGTKFTDMNPRMQDAIKANIDAFRRKMLEAENMLKYMDDEIGLRFDVERDINSRVRYIGEFSPTDKTFMTLFHNEDQLFSIKSKSDAEFAMRSALIAVGEKAEGIHDPAEIQSKFNALAKVLLNKDGDVKAKYRYSENNTAPVGNLIKDLKKAGFDYEPKHTHSLLNSISNIAKALKNKSADEFVMFSEGDSKLSGVANTLALLGYTDTRLGLGGKIDISVADMYMQVASDLGISRSEAKPSTIGNNYLAGPDAAAAAFGDLIVKTLMRGEEVSPKITNQLAFLRKLDMFQSGQMNIKRRLDVIDRLNEIADIKMENPEMSFAEIASMNEARYGMLKELKALDDIASSKNNILGADVIHLAIGLFELDNKLRIGDKAYDALVKYFANMSKNNLDVALTNLYKNFDGVLQFRKDMKQLTHLAKESFALKYNTVLTKDTVHAKQKIVDILKQLGHQADDQLVNDIYTSAMSDASKNAQGLSLKNIINGIAFNGKLNNQIYSIKEMRDIIPMMTIGNGKKAPMVTVKGYAGYQNSVNYKTATPIDVFAPVFTINYDVLIMANALQKNMTNVMDAFVGAKSMHTATKTANMTVAAIGRDVNPYTIMRDTLDDLMYGIQKYSGASKDAKFWLTQQQMSKAGKHATPENVIKAMDNKELDILSLDHNNGPYMFREKLDARSKETAQRKARNYSPDTVVDNYSIGMPDSVVKVGDAQHIDMTVARPDKKFDTDRSYTYIFEDMKDVKTSEGNMPARLSDFNSDKNVAETDITFEINPGEKGSLYIPGESGGKVILKHEKPSPEGLREAVHEFTHGVVDGNSHYITDLQDAIIDLVKDRKLTRTDGTPIWGKLNSELINAGEPIANIMHDLYTNELFMRNYKDLGYAFKEKNMFKHIREYKAGDTSIYTVKDLVKYFSDNDMPIQANHLKAVARGVNAAMHSSPNFISWIGDRPRERFNSVLNDVSKIYMLRKAAIAKVNDRISGIGIADLFTLDASKDAIELMASIKTGAEKGIGSMTAELYNSLRKRLENVADADALDSAIGKMTINGFGEFMKEFSAAVDSEHFIRLVNEKMTRSKRLIDAEFDGKTIAKLEKEISKLAKGKNRYDAQRIADNILKSKYPVSSNKVLAKRKALKDYIIKAAAAERITSRPKSTGRLFSRMAKPENKAIASDFITMLYTDFNNEKTMFNTNVEYDLTASNKRLYVVPKDQFKGKSKNILARQKIDGVEYYAVAKSDKSFIVGQQQSHIMQFDLGSASYGIYKKKVGKNSEFIINPLNMNTKAEAVDFKATTMITKNAYAKMYKDIGRDSAFRQYEALRDAGVLITEAEYKKLPTGERANFKKPFKKNKNPLDAMFTGHYFNKKWEHYIEGSKGMDLGKKKMSKVLGKELGGIVSQGLKLIIGLTKALKGPLLVYRPASYINNYVSNMMIYTINSNTLLPDMAMSKARKGVAEYKELLTKAMDVESSPAGRAAAKAALEKHELHYAFKHGIANTIRSDAYTLGTAQENILISNLKDITGDDRMSTAFKTLLADPSTKWGAYVGELFDATEMYPKVMLYMDKIAGGASPKEAVQHVLLAFPTYNNLSVMLNAIDQISPYTKYMANYPKILGYAMSNNVGKLAAVNAMFLMGARATYGETIDEDESFWYDENYIKVFGIGYKAYESANPYWVPSKTLDEFGIVDFNFIPSAGGTLLSPTKTLSPLTIPQ